MSCTRWPSSPSGMSLAPGTWPSTYSSGSRTSRTAAPSAKASAKVSMSTSGASRLFPVLVMPSFSFGAGLGSQPVDPPAGPVQLVADPVVQAVLAALPQLHPVRHHQEPTPVRRPRDVPAGEAGLDRG